MFVVNMEQKRREYNTFSPFLQNNVAEFTLIQQQPKQVNALLAYNIY